MTPRRHTGLSRTPGGADAKAASRQNNTGNKSAKGSRAGQPPAAARRRGPKQRPAAAANPASVPSAPSGQHQAPRPAAPRKRSGGASDRPAPPPAKRSRQGGEAPLLAQVQQPQAEQASLPLQQQPAPGSPRTKAEGRLGSAKLARALVPTKTAPGGSGSGSGSAPTATAAAPAPASAPLAAAGASQRQGQQQQQPVRASAPAAALPPPAGPSGGAANPPSPSAPTPSSSPAASPALISRLAQCCGTPEAEAAGLSPELVGRFIAAFMGLPVEQKAELSRLEAAGLLPLLERGQLAAVRSFLEGVVRRSGLG